MTSNEEILKEFRKKYLHEGHPPIPDGDELALELMQLAREDSENRIAELKNLLERWDSWYGGNLYAETRLVADTRKALKKEVDEDGSKK